MYNIFDVISSDCSHDSAFKLYAQMLVLHLVVLSLIFSLTASNPPSSVSHQNKLNPLGKSL